MKNAIVRSGENAGETLTFVPMATEKVKMLNPGTRVKVYSAYCSKGSGIVNVKINGKPKTWKTRPNDVSVPVKYGLYEYATVNYTNGEPVEPLYFIEVVETSTRGIG